MLSQRREMMQMHLEGPWIATLYRSQRVVEIVVRLLEALWNLGKQERVQDIKAM